MSAEFCKINYTDNIGYRLLHAKGEDGADSTLDYLHYSSNYIIIYFHCGNGRIKIEGRSYIIREGDMIIINPSEIFQFSVDGGSYHERLTLSVNEALIKDFPYDCSSLFSPFYKREKGVGNRISAQRARDMGLDSLMLEILDCIKSPEPSQKALSFCKTIEFLVRLGGIVKPDESYNDESEGRHPLINSVLVYLNLHFKENISIEDVAGEFNIDKSYLSHLFKEQVGMSLWTYVVLRRIQQVNALMRRCESVEQACYGAGFQNYSNFFRLYKKYMKIAPTEYKKQLKVRRE